ncbi:hypothetical protein CDD81_8103 [Ophiocordyceps australis]|uniref:MHD domain-containing protein n=1 Tax=Ophiocordyceps australis TaxID=1399860 RepID=A0A2C5X8R5_9HYPO|nr:hypothetical protein CDD81_8103 [Ophiocordyceps australis]
MEVSRAEYPGMLAHLQPGSAVHILNDRIKRINKINIEIADWLQERRRVEEQYALGLRKLAQFRAPNSASELGVFESPWARVIESVKRMAQSHHILAERIEVDVEHQLRAYQQRHDYQNMQNISLNLASMAKDLEEAQERSEKLGRKGARASGQKLDAATSKLESATQQWESQAPFIFETLQALDESRINQLRDLLTQYQTLETDQAQRTQDNVVETLAAMLEISTEREIQLFSQRTTSGKPVTSARMLMRRPSTAVAGPEGAAIPTQPVPSATFPIGSAANATAPTLAQQATNPTALTEDDTASENNSTPADSKSESKLRRLGTMFSNRRRQSIAGFGSFATSKHTPSPFGRLGSSHGRNISPRPSSSNLHQDSARLSSLAEAPDQPNAHDATGRQPDPGGANGVLARSHSSASATHRNGTRLGDATNATPPLGPPAAPPADAAPALSQDSEGFTIRAPMNDPISEAQREAASDEADQLFKLNIKNNPVEEEDPEAKQAALSSVANTLKMGPATRRSSTLRGRRDLRNTIYAPAPNSSIPESFPSSAIPSLAGSPPATSSSFSKPPAIAALASEASATGTSDTQSVRSGNSLGSLVHAKHPDLAGPGLNVSVIESVSAMFEDGQATHLSIGGEIAFSNNSSNSTKSHEMIRINNFSRLERISPNRIFVHNASPDQPDQFSLDVSHLSKTTIGFSYRLLADDAHESAALVQHAPLLLKPVWKPQGDKLGLLLQYRLNPAATAFTSPVTLHNVVFIVTYEGRASGAQTKPSGTHLKDKHIVYWRLGDVELTPDTQKLVCRIVGLEGVAPLPGHVEARWEYAAPGNEALGSGISISKLADDKGKAIEATEDDPFADESVNQSWLDVPLQRKLVSGKYEAK